MAKTATPNDNIRRSAPERDGSADGLGEELALDAAVVENAAAAAEAPEGLEDDA